MANPRLVLIEEPLRLQDFAAMLRMGKKYMMPGYYNSAVQQLSKDFPRTLEDWDKLTPNETLLDWEGVDTLPIDVANIAQTTGATVLLPALFCDFIITPKQAIEGVKRVNGTTAFLSVENQIAFIAGKQALVEEGMDLVLGWLHEGPDGCTGTMGCKTSRQERFIKRILEKGNFNPLEKWDNEWSNGLCTGCFTEGKKLHDIGRQLLWDQLPSFYGLADWDALVAESTMVD
jgi:hypothetical protein